MDQNEGSVQYHAVNIYGFTVLITSNFIPPKEKLLIKLINLSVIFSGSPQKTIVPKLIEAQ